MSYYPDLAACDYFQNWSDVLLAIGWLEPGQAFTQGSVSTDFLKKLTTLASNPVQDPLNWSMIGYHACGFCREQGKRCPSEIELFGQTVHFGQKNLFVPAASSHVFVAPTLIVHYITEHRYSPPAAFQTAVMECPAMRSRAYYQAMKARKAKVWSWFTALRTVL